MDNVNPETRAATIARLKRLWESDPGSYWSELRAAGLTTTEVWPQHANQRSGSARPKDEADSSKRRR